MPHSTEHVLRQMRRHMPPENLFPDIWSHIAALEARRVRGRAFFAVASVVALFVLVLVVAAAAVTEIARSEFPQYVSLVFSDGGAVVSSWKDLALLLVESLPLSGITAATAALLVSLGGVKYIIRTVNTPLVFTYTA